MRTGDELAELLSSRLDGLAAIAAYLFGSHARGNPSPLSDIDVALLVGHADIEQRERVAAEAFRRLSDLGEIDVVVLDDAPLRLAGRVLTEGRRLSCTDDVARVRYEAATRSMYFDFEPLAAELDQLYLRKLAAEER